MYKSLKRLDYPRHLAFLNEEKLILVRKLTKSEPWEDISNTRHDISKVIFFDPELNEFKPEYKLDLLNLIIEFTLEEFCEKMEYCGMKIYNYKSYTEYGYPETLLFDILKNTFTLEFLNEKKIKLNIPKLLTPTPITTPRTQITPTPRTQVIPTPRTQVIPTPRTQVIPTQIKTVTPIPVDRLIVNRTMTRSLKRHIIECRSGGNITKGRKLNEDYGQIREPLESNDIELNTNKYKIEILNQGYWYKFSTNSCSYVKVLGNKLWKRQNSEPHPKSLYYYKAQKIIILEFETNFILFRLNGTQETYEIPPIKLYELDESGNMTKMTRNQYSISLILFDGVQILYKIEPECPMVKYNLKIVWKRQNLKESVKTILYNLTNGALTIETDKIMLFRDETKWVKMKFPYFKLFSEDALGNIIPTPLDKWSLEIRQSRHIFNFQNANCTMVKYFENSIWCKTGDSYPRKMIFGIRTKILILEFEDYFNVCSFNQDRWVKRQLNIPPIHLFKLNPEGNLIHLTREDYKLELINTRFMTLLLSINRDIKCVSLSFRKTIVWTCNSNNYPYFIIYSGCNNKLYLTFEKEITVYKYKSRKWYEKSYKIPPIELYTEANGNLLLLDFSSYRIHLRDENKNISYYYIFNGVKCTQIKFNNKLVWKINGRYPTSITYINGIINLNFGIKIIKIKPEN